MKTAASESVIDTIVKPISPRSRPATPSTDRAFLDVAIDVLQHHDRVVDDEADRTGSAPSSTGCRGCSPSMYMTANVPMIEKGSARLGMTVAQTFRRKTKMTMMTSPASAPS
jgi:hypothetical protein